MEYGLDSLQLKSDQRAEDQFLIVGDGQLSQRSPLTVYSCSRGAPVILKKHFPLFLWRMGTQSKLYSNLKLIKSVITFLNSCFSGYTFKPTFSHVRLSVIQTYRNAMHAATSNLLHIIYHTKQPPTYCTLSIT